jgi:hypothetical protein
MPGGLLVGRDGDTAADRRLQVITPTLLQTYNPTELSRVGISACRMPGKGAASTIQIEVVCKRPDAELVGDEACILAETAVTKQFVPFVTARLQN